MRKLARRDSRSDQSQIGEARSRRTTSTGSNITRGSGIDAAAEQQLQRESASSVERNVIAKATNESASVARLQAAMVKAKSKQAEDGIGSRIRASPRKGSQGKHYDVREIFRSQRNGVRLDFDDRPTQWDSTENEPEEELAEEELTEPRTLHEKLEAARQSHINTKNQTPAVTPQKKPQREGRGRPREPSSPASSAVPSPLVTRATVRVKRRRDPSPEVTSKRRLTASESPRLQLSSGHESPSPTRTEIVETEGETDAEYDIGPTADEEIELGHDLLGDDDRQAKSTRSSSRPTEASQSSSLMQPRNLRARKSRRDQRSHRRLTTVAEEAAESSLHPETPAAQVENEDDEYEEEILEQDSENDGEWAPKDRRKATEEQQKSTVEPVITESEPQHVEKPVDVFEFPDETSDERQSELDASKSSARNGKTMKSKTRNSAKSHKPGSHPSTNQKQDANGLFVTSNEHDEQPHTADQEYLELEGALADVPMPTNSSYLERESNKEVNQLLEAAREYRESIEAEGYLEENYCPVVKKFRKCSKSLKALYNHVVEFIAGLEEDFVFENDALPRETWVTYHGMAEDLQDLVLAVESTSKSNTVVYGLFSLVPMVAATFRFQHALELQTQSSFDVKKSLKLLSSVLESYEILQGRIRSVKYPSEQHTQPIYGPAFALKKHVNVIYTHVKKRQARIRHEEKLEKEKQNEAAHLILLEERNKIKTTVHSFDIKRNRLLALWNLRQEHEPNMHLRMTKFGSAQISEYWKTHLQPRTGFVKPLGPFDWVKLAFTAEEIASLEGALKKHYKLGPYKMWSAIFMEKCGYGGTLKSRTVDQLLNVAKFLKQYYLEEVQFVDDFWAQIPDLDLCDLLPMRRADISTAA